MEIIMVIIKKHPTTQCQETSCKSSKPRILDKYNICTVAVKDSVIGSGKDPYNKALLLGNEITSEICEKSHITCGF